MYKYKNLNTLIRCDVPVTDIICDECGTKVVTICSCTDKEFELLKEQINVYKGNVQHYVIKEDFTAMNAGMNNAIEMVACCEECAKKIADRLIKDNFNKIRTNGGGILNARTIKIAYIDLREAKIFR